MAVKLADAVAFMSTDNTKLKSGLAEAEGDIQKSGNGFSSVLSGVGMSIGMGVAGIAADALVKVTSFMSDSVGAASDLAETTSKVSVLFGESSDEILAWAENSERAMGLTETAALDAVGGIGNMFMQLGAGAEEAAAVGENMVQLSADIASFHNVSGGATEVLDTMSAAFRGEYDSLQKYIPTINAAAVEQEALAATGKASAKELTALEKAAAVQAIVMRDAGAAVGDFARTAGGAANQQRILDAQMSELSTTIGAVLLPAQTAITTAMNDMLTTVLPPLSDFMQTRVAPAFTMIADAINQYVMPAVTAIIAWFGSLGASMSAQTDGPMSYMAAWFAENMPRIQTIVQTVLSALQSFWDQHGQAITDTVQTYLDWLMRFWDTVMKTVLDIVSVALQLLTGDFEGAGETLKGVLDRWFEMFRDGIMAIVDGIGEWFQSVDWGAVGQAIVDGIWAGLRGAWDNMQDWFIDRLQEWRNLLPFSEPRDPASPLRGLSRSGAAMVEMVRSGIEQAGSWSLPKLELPKLDLAGAGASAGAGAPVNIAITINGMTDAEGAGRASRDGVLAGLRAAGWK